MALLVACSQSTRFIPVFTIFTEYIVGSHSTRKSNFVMDGNTTIMYKWLVNFMQSPSVSPVGLANNLTAIGMTGADGERAFMIVTFA